LVAHPALGFPVEYITKPSERYNNGGDLTLVDGVIGVKPWKGNEWVGFDTGVVEFIVDLEKVLPISSFQLNFLEDKGSWIHLPNTVQLSYSKDKTHWEFLEEKQVVTNLSKTNEMPSVFVQEVSKSARYIKVLVKRTQKIPEGEPGEGNQPWIFMDELMLFFDK
jgi:hexosaminidase